MAWGNVLVFGAHTTLRQAIADARARDAEFAVFRHGDDLFAFRPWELEAVEALDRSALEALALLAWKKSPPVLASQASRPPLYPDPMAPSSQRFVVVGDDGEPRHVEEPAGRRALLGGPGGARDPDRGRMASGTRPAAAAADEAPHGAEGLVLDDELDEQYESDEDAGESATIVRYPSIDVSGERRRGSTVLLRIDLAAQVDAATAGDPMVFDDLPAGWRELPISVVVSSPQLQFADGSNEGTVRIRRDLPSVACTIAGTLTAEGEQRIDVAAVFSRDDRWCGTAQRTFPAAAAAAEPTTGTVNLVGGAIAPDLTIHIHRDAGVPGRLQWLLWPALAHRASIAGDVWSETRLDGDPGAFVSGVFQAIAAAGPDEHVMTLQAIGELLWDKVPERVRATYWQLRDKLGDGFSIQLVTDEPVIPWELVRPLRAGTADTRLLAETHPVARALPAYCDRLCATLPAGGARLTVAPDYTRRGPPMPALPALVHARSESTALQQRFGAVPVAGSAVALVKVLEDREETPVQLLHFAGHGTFGRQALLSSIAFEDGDLRVAHIRHQGVVLGENYRTFVIFNACEAGATGDVLGDVGGWAEAFAYRRFGGFLAPLWAVFDDPARRAMEQFLELVLVHRRRIGEALRDVRRAFGDSSATFLSYIYYGDVNARFG